MLTIRVLARNKSKLTLTYPQNENQGKFRSLHDQLQSALIIYSFFHDWETSYPIIDNKKPKLIFHNRRLKITAENSSVFA